MSSIDISGSHNRPQLNSPYNLDSDEKENEHTNKFNTHNEFKLNYEEIEEEDIEDMEDNNAKDSKEDNMLRNQSFKYQPSEDKFNLIDYVDQLKEDDRSYTPPIRLEGDNDGGHVFEDSLVGHNDFKEGGAESYESFGQDKKSVISPGKSDEMIDLQYDPILDCYVDPKTNL